MKHCESAELFVLQRWIQPRTTADQGYWDWDLSDVFLSEHEADTERIEFHAHSLTRIVPATMRLNAGEDVIQ